MARAGETPTAAYQGLDYGQNVAANQMAEMIDPSYDPLADYTPDNIDHQFLTSPTDRPAEPLTHGVPFGPGANYAPMPQESAASFSQRVQSDLQPFAKADPRVARFLKRTGFGE